MRVWFVQKMDHGRVVSVVPCEMDAEGRYRVCRIAPLVDRHPIHPNGVLEGNQDDSNLFPATEAQQLMDALWDAGLRPKVEADRAKLS